MPYEEAIKLAFLNWLWRAIEAARKAGDEDAVAKLTAVYRYLSEVK